MLKTGAENTLLLFFIVILGISKTLCIFNAIQCQNDKESPSGILPEGSWMQLEVICYFWYKTQRYLCQTNKM